MYKLWNDALLRREIDLHLLRRESGRNWSYPGPGWMLVASLWQLLPMSLLGWNPDEHRLLSMANIARAALIWQTMLLILRAVISCSVSVAEEVEKKTLVILHTTPLGLGRLLITKLGVCLWPLLVEIGFLTVFYQVLNGIHPFASWQSLLKLQFLQLAITLFYGCLGLWLGGIIGHTEKASAYARVTAFVTVVGCAVMQTAYAFLVALAGGMFFFCLVVQPQSRPRAYQSGVLAVVVLLVGQALWQALGSAQPNFQLSEFSPAWAIWDQNSAASPLYLTLAVAFGYLSYRQVLKTA